MQSRTLGEDGWMDIGALLGTVERFWRSQGPAAHSAATVATLSPPEILFTFD